MIHALEKYNLPYTGANAAFYSLKKDFMQSVVKDNGFFTPAYLFVYQLEQVELAFSALKFPMIVKHHNGYGSIGMTKDCKVTNH